MTSSGTRGYTEARRKKKHLASFHVGLDSKKNILKVVKNTRQSSKHLIIFVLKRATRFLRWVPGADLIIKN